MPKTYLKQKNPIYTRSGSQIDGRKSVYGPKIGALTKILLLKKENLELRELLKKEKENKQARTYALSTVSHDCRSPLTSIQLSTSLIERYYDRLDKEKIYAHLEKIKLAIVGLTDKLNELTEV